MNTVKSIGTLCAALVAVGTSGAAFAQDEGGKNAQSVEAFAEQEAYSDGLGKLKSVSLEYKLVNDDTTVVFTPAVGERSVGAFSETAFGAGVAVYFKLSEGVSTRTYAAIAEDEPVFANRQLAQDVTFNATKDTTITVGGRWARYFGDRDVYFVSAGARHYFKGGSVSYRLSYVDPEGRDGFLAHLVNLSLNDRDGRGKTQLWLGAGAASLDRPIDQPNFSGEDYSATLRRVQPLTGQLSLVGQVGITSFDRPAGRVEATNIGVGLRLDFGE